MIDLATVATNLVQNTTGVWVARDQRAVSYPASGNDACFAVEDTSFWFRHRNRVISHFVTTLSPTDTFFDIGGGNGCVSLALQEAGIDVVLLEPGASGVRNAVKRGVKTVVQATLEDAGFTPNSIPSAGLFDVLEHIGHELDFLRSLYTHLQPTGNLYVTVPAYNALWSVDDVDAGHFRRYTARSLTSALEEAGFKIEYCSYVFSFLVPAILLLRSIPGHMGLRKAVSAATTQKEHSRGPGISGAIVEKCLSVELNRIRKGKGVPFGSSCLAVATKSA